MSAIHFTERQRQSTLFNYDWHFAHKRAFACEWVCVCVCVSVCVPKHLVSFQNSFKASWVVEVYGCRSTSKLYHKRYLVWEFKANFTGLESCISVSYSWIKIKNIHDIGSTLFLKTLDFHQTRLLFLIFRETTTCSVLRDRQQGIVTKILKITCIAVKMFPCRSFTACKRSLNVKWKSAFRQNFRTFIAHSSTFRRWVLSRGDTRREPGGESWNF